MQHLRNGHGVTVRKIDPANPADTRGPTWQWLPEASKQITVCVRKAGSVSCHVHKGKDPSKDPEQLFVVKGEVRFICYDPEGEGEAGEWVLGEGQTIEIDPGIIHRTEVLEDAIILEARRTPFNPKKPDTKPAEIPAEVCKFLLR